MRTTRAWGDGLAAAAITASAALAVLPVPRSWDVYATRYAGLMVCTGLWLLAWASGGLRTPEKRDWWWIGGWGALSLVALASSALSYAPLEMLTYGSGYFMGASSWIAMAVCAICASLVRPGSRFGSALRWAVVPVFLVGVVAVAQAATGQVVRAGFDNSNHLVPGLLLGAGVALSAAYGSGSRLRRAVLRGAAAVMVLAAAVSGSLTGVLVAVLMLVVVLQVVPESLSLAADRARRYAVAMTAALTALIVLVALFAAGLGPRAVREKVLGPAAATRLELWRIALSSTRERPVIGTGPATFEISVQRTIGSSQGAESLLMDAIEQGPIAEDPHDLPLRLLAEFGIAGLAAAGVVSFAWLRRSGLVGPGAGTARKALSVGVVAWAASLLLLPLSVQWGAWPAVVAGCAIAAPGDGDESARRGRRRVLVPALAIAGVLAAGYFACAALAGAWHMARAEALPDNRSVLAEVRRAVSAQPGMGYHRFVELDVRGRLLDGSAAALKAYQQAVDAAGPYVLEDARYMAMLVRNSLDDAYLTGRTDLSWESRHLARIATLAPRLPEVRMEVAHLALLSGDLQRASDELVALRPFASRLKRYGLYRYYYARFAGLEQFIEQARREAAVDAEIERLLDGPDR